MCYAILEIAYKNDKERKTKKVAIKDDLSRELGQLEKLGTVEKVTVFVNHHTRKLTETWVDEIYQEPVVEVMK